MFVFNSWTDTKHLVIGKHYRDYNTLLILHAYILSIYYEHVKILGEGVLGDKTYNHI